MMRAVLKDASDHPAWQKTPRRPHANGLRKHIVDTSVTAARDCKNTRLLTRLLVEVHPDTDLRRVSGIDGVLRMRPQASLTREGGVAEAGAQPQGS